MKRTLIWISGIIVLFICATWLGLHYLQSGYLAQRIGTATQNATGSPLVFKQNPTISLFPPAVKFGSASWEGTQDGSQITFTAKGGVAELDLEKLFGGRLEIGDIILEKPIFEIVENAHGQSTPGSQGKNPDAGMELPSIDLGRLVVQGGGIVYKSPQNVITLKNINLSAENLHKRQEADIKCDFALHIDPADMEARKNVPQDGISGNLAFKGKMRFYAPNLTFRHAAATFTATEAGFLKDFSPLRLAFDGGMNLNDLNFLLHHANLAVPQGTLELKGEGNLAAATFNGNGNLEASLGKLAGYLGLEQASGAKPENDPIILAGPVSLRQGNLALEDMAIKLANGSGTGKISVTVPASGAPSIEGHVNLGNVSLNGFSLAAAQTQKKDASSSGQLSSKSVHAAYPELNFRVDIAEVEIEKLHVSKLGFLVHGNAGAYRVDDFTFNVANGGVLASAQANLTTNEMSMQANGHDVDLGKALTEIGIEGLQSGRTRFAASLRATGEDLRALKSSISGKGQVESRGLKIPALNSIAQILQLFDSRTIDLGDSFTVISALFSAENGHVHFSPITATSQAISLEGGAVVNLHEDYLDGNANIRALGLELPVTFAGPFTDIKLGVNPDVILNANKNLPKALLRSIGLEETPSPAGKTSGRAGNK